MTTTAFVNCSVRRLPQGALAEWLVLEDDRVAAVGSGDPPSADRTIDAAGATVLPAFRDAHVHLPATGLYLAGLDLRGIDSSAGILERLRSHARTSSTRAIFGGNFEDAPGQGVTRYDLDAAAPDRDVLLARADMHSCVVSSPLLSRLPVEGLEGVDRDVDGRPTGYLREKAAAEAWTWFDRSMSAADQHRAVAAAVQHAYSKGVCEVHEMFVVEWRGWDSAEVFLAMIDDFALHIDVWLATEEVERVRELGLPRVGGDLFLDGSFGSHTAWLSQDYDTPPPEGSPPRGISYRSDDELLQVFLQAQRSGMQTGVHAIGDAAIDQAIGMWEKVAAEVGEDAVRDLGHRIEHFECASDEHIRRAGALGLRGSIQPAFDRFWGGDDGLYARRLGRDRAREMNRFGTMLASGLVLGAGSDSTVTPLDPFLQMASLREHHLEDERVSALDALGLNTLGPAALAGAAGERGTLEPGMRADVVLVDRDPVVVTTAEMLETEVLATWAGGTQVWPPGEAGSA